MKNFSNEGLVNVGAFVPLSLHLDLQFSCYSSRNLRGLDYGESFSEIVRLGLIEFNKELSKISKERLVF
jgi:hypothetical protein